MLACMADMPQRRRSHRLETEARGHFASLIHDHGWVVRPIDQPDYGIDDLVEIFEGDLGTGHTFLVQSRGTDSELPDALKVRVRHEQQSYFRGFSDPVLIARYHSPSEKTLVTWFHQVDPYPRRANATITLRLDDELTPDRVEALGTEVQRFRAFRSSAAPWPLELALETGGDDSREIALRVGLIISALPETIRLGSGSSAFQVTATVTPEILKVDAGLASHTVHANTSKYSPSDVAAGIVLGCATVIDRLGHGGRAADLVEVGLKAKGAPAEVIEELGQAIGRVGRVDAAINVARHWLGLDDAACWAAAVLLLGAACGEAPRRVVADRRVAAELLEKVAEKTNVDSLREVGGAALLVAARVRFALGDWEKANDDFARAGEAGETGDRPELLAEVAGAAHHVADYERAIEIYGEALKGDPDRLELVARMADSQMCAGHLVAARESFDSYVSQCDWVGSIWLLKQGALEFLLGSGIVDTTPDPAAAMAILQSATPDESGGGLVARCLQAAEADPLNSAAWTELGQHQLREKRFGRAFGPLLVAAVASRTPEAWARLFVAAHVGQNTELAERSAQVAAGDHGEAFHLAVWTAADGRDDAEAIAKAADDIDLAGGHWRRGDAQPLAGDETKS